MVSLRNRKFNYLIVDSIILILAICVIFYLVFPFLSIILTAIRPEEDIFAKEFSLFSDSYSLDNFRKIFSGKTNFTQYILNSIVVSLIATVISVFISMMTAYGLTRFRYKGRRIMITGVAFTQLFPFVVLILPLYLVYWKIGFVNSFFGLIISYIAISLPYSIFLLMGYISSIPISIDEAAIIDGCNRMQTIFKIIFPVALPGIAATAVFSFLRSWNEYLFALTLMTDDMKKTVPVGLAGFFGEYTADWGAIMAASVVATIPTVIFFFIMQKQIISGLSAGAVKQ